MRTLFRRKPAPAPPRIPEGQRIYAIGDIHGRADLLAALHEQIAADAADCELHCRIVYLGDYIDRGLESRQVIDLLLRNPLPDFDVITLMGNHEAEMLAFLEKPLEGAGWLSIGGLATLYSYGVAVPEGMAGNQKLQALHENLKAALPPEHLAFFQSLAFSATIGDYFFTHAGVRPGVPLAKQATPDLLGIRGEFLDSADDFGKVVVHGHTIREKPDIRPNRISLDTGAFASGILTCLVLESDKIRFLST